MNRFCLKTLSILPIALLFIALNQGCNKISLEEDHQLAYIKTTEQLADAMNGAYGKFYAQFDNMVDNFHDRVLRTDDIRHRPGMTDFYFQTNPGVFEFIAGPRHTNTNFWIETYSAIASINNIIVQYEKGWLTEEGMSQIVGEAYFFRAFTHFWLTRLYGEIFYITNNEVVTRVERLSVPDVYQYIEADYLKAVELLPSNNLSARAPYDTPHQGTAKALLAEAYLHWAGYPANDKSKYQLAAEMAEEVIDNANNYGFRVVDDFADLWKNNTWQNSETLLTIHRSGWFIAPSFDNNFQLPFHPLAPDLFVIFGLNQAPAAFFNSFPNGYRKDITFHNSLYISPMAPGGHFDEGYIHLDSVNVNMCIPYRKHFFEPHMAYGQYRGNNKISLFRFSRTLLTYAEASARSGNMTDKAYECLNIIRRRANKVALHNAPSPFDVTPGLSNEAFAELVVKERAWEFAGEIEGRWHDLVRLEMVEEIIPFYNSGSAVEVNLVATSKDDYFFDPPQSDLNLN